MKILYKLSECVVNNTTLILIMIATCASILTSCSQREKTNEYGRNDDYSVQGLEYKPSNQIVRNGGFIDNSSNSVMDDKIDYGTSDSPLSESSTSRFYNEGYDAGYDDGEDDAVNENGWMGQYDQSCKYKGKSRKDYEQGYEDGYEAGYDDNYESADE